MSDYEPSHFVCHVTCPFHEGDDVPSLAIYSNGTAYCFACATYCKVSDIANINQLTKLARIKQKPVKEKVNRLYKTLRENDNNISEQLYYKFHKNLSSKHRQYWHKERGLYYRTIDKYLIGWTGQFYSIPIYKNNRPYSLAFRRHELDTISMKYMVLKGTVPILFNNDLLYLDKLLITEGFVDCLTMTQVGFPSVCSIIGSVNGFKKQWAKLFENKQIYILLDNDQAGQIGADNLHALLPNSRVIRVPEQYKDVNEFWVDCCRSNRESYFIDYFNKLQER